MADVAFVAVFVAFFALLTLFIRGCDRIIGAADAEVSGSETASPAPDREKTAA
jgi:hypothetical protein